ncbi:hypothetical protein GCM10007972_23520 [Iodidimonas muriae]|uniref:Uncharacterized protein n=1 Tax=Iodidimonas muriae TaxID=261467 RepID=A0ABQ2LH85_9PROT|nr:hypothetical protein JCM17843_29180 [Kordiimonadales bacterium JCM 17843]GGO15414.1 hypothetical protein GCM10007972_23520 [Iodidimonas muriae]
MGVLCRARDGRLTAASLRVVQKDAHKEGVGRGHGNDIRYGEIARSSFGILGANGVQIIERT